MSNDGVWVKVYPDAAGGAPGAAVIGDATADDPLFPVNTFSFTEDGQAYDVYEYLGSGQLVVDEPGMVDALVVGGGAGGSTDSGGGGGGGGLLAAASAYLSSGSQIVVVGGGGAGADGTGNELGGRNGVTSRIGPYYATGGGPGGHGNSARTGFFGGSGGGGSIGSAGGSGTDGQGKSGGSAASSSAQGAGGGGGAGAAGSNGTTSAGGNGGDGLASLITGSSVTYGGGGGGGATGTAGGSGGSGGGGAGTVTGGTGTSGTANTGGGGGGTGRYSIDRYQAGAGGSGIVIVRVKVASPSFGPKTRSAVRTAHAARVENGVVRQVIVIPHLDDDDAKITEYCNRIGLAGTWIDTSYTGSRRGKYAGVGDSFDVKARSGEGEFVSPVTEIVEEA